MSAHDIGGLFLMVAILGSLCFELRASRARLALLRILVGRLNRLSERVDRIAPACLGCGASPPRNMPACDVCRITDEQYDAWRASR